ncbi:MAG: protein translocase subunit SecDF [Flavobacteriaceae bacterium]|nr:protein translocase subunit SecDF [Flavobacteriaceae bacterium]
MQNKGLVKLFAILFGLVSLYQLSFTFLANKVEDEAAAHATAELEQDNTLDYDKVAQAYLDNAGNEEIMMGITYNKAKANKMNLGLDLKGGINVIIQIAVKDILVGLTNDSQDEVFRKALVRADEIQKDAQETYLESFLTAFEEINAEMPADKKSALNSPNVFATRALETDGITTEASDTKVASVLKDKINESVESAMKVLNERIDQFGVAQPNITRLGKDSGRILVELPGAKDKERVLDLIGTTAQLEFWETYTATEMGGFLGQLNSKLSEKETAKNKNQENPQADADKADDSTSTDSTATNKEESFDNLLGADKVIDSTSNPLRDLMVFDPKHNQAGGPFLATFALKDTAAVNGYLKTPEARSLLTGDRRFTKFVWSKVPKDSSYTNLVALKYNRTGKPKITGDYIERASADFGADGKPVVTMQMDGVGAKLWEEFTGRVYENKSFLAVVLDDIVYSAPSCSNGAISGGNTEISGNFLIPETQDLASVLQAGKLPAKVNIVQAEVVGPSLGKAAISSGTKSFIIALSLVLIWMMFYYGRAGLFADIALAFNILLIFGFLASLKAALTLPGIAGIVLTIGMSVDANVLIFERIREELNLGKSQMDAIKDGFSNALSSILDANITTGLTGIILFIFGTGPIKGFATTLLIGIFTSLFTAIFITRLLIHWYVKNGKNKLDFATPMTKNWFRNLRINFLKKRKVAYIISGVLIIAGIGSLFTNKLNYGIEFEGGSSYIIKLEKSFDTEKLTNDFKGAFIDNKNLEILPEIKTIGNATENKLKFDLKAFDSKETYEDDIQAEQALLNKIFEGFKEYLPEGYTLDQFSVDDPQKSPYGVGSSYKVVESISDDYKANSLWAVLGSLFVVFLYILFRFKWWQFSLGAVAAVFHDVLIVLGIFSLTYKFLPFSMEINQAFIAAILTVIGYSLNDTVVVFDRIREYYNKNEDWAFGKTVNRALSSTLSRTLNTSFTTLIVLLIIFTFGADSLRGLIFALIIGVLVGTYSSLFIATPVMFDTVGKKELQRDKVEEEEEEETTDTQP